MSVHYSNTLLFPIHPFFENAEGCSIKIEYYVLRNKSHEYHCSFIGYSTNGGKHGIHYNRTKNQYYFGHLNPTVGSMPIALYPGLEIKIPSKLKDGLVDVANKRSESLIRKST